MGGGEVKTACILILFLAVIFLTGWMYFLQETVKGMSFTFWQTLQALKDYPTLGSKGKAGDNENTGKEKAGQDK